MQTKFKIAITFFIVLLGITVSAQKVIILDKPLNESINLEAGVTVILKPGFVTAPGIVFNAAIDTLPPQMQVAQGDGYQLNENLNWTSSITYDIAGEITSSGISYFNTLGKPTQSQITDIKTGKIWATEVLYDIQGRPALQTLSAPITDEEVSFQGYNNDFTTLTINNVESITDDNTNLPVISSNPKTLGWYYSNNNDSEAYQDITANPYAKIIYSTLNPGSALKTLGGNKITINGEEKWVRGFSYSTPAPQEMYYVFGYDFFSKKLNLNNDGFSIIDAQFTSTMVSCVVEELDANCLGTENFTNIRFMSTFLPNIGSFYQIEGLGDKLYRILTSVIGGDPNAIGSNSLIPVQFDSCEGVNNYDEFIILDQISTSTSQHLITLKVNKTVSIDVHGNESVVFTDTDGKTLATARSGDSNHSQEVLSLIGKQGFIDIHIPKNTNGNIEYLGGSSSEYKVWDLKTELTISPTPTNLQPGFYRIEALDNRSAEKLTLTYIDKSNNNRIEPVFNSSMGVRYNVSYYDFTINYYDKAGKLNSSLQPLGFDSNCLSAIQPTVNHNQAFMSTYKYNSLGQLLTTSSPDEGTANFKYRKDGQIRFSQNDKQASANPKEFSYTNYDNLGRPVESGVYNEGTITFDNADNLLDSILNDITVDDDGLPNTNCKEQHYTLYDVYDNTNLHSTGISTSNYPSQSFLAGNVSKTYTSNPNTTTTWYSYDIYGRVTWLVQQIEGLGTKTIDYEYDPVTSEVTKVYYQKYIPTETFIHKYDYNVVGQLVNVETSTDDITFTDQARYEYYETGALKRVELADNLQGIDYVYNLAGQLKDINSPNIGTSNTAIFRDPGKDGINGLRQDIFGMEIDYHFNDYLRLSDNTPYSAFLNADQDGNRFDGNIAVIRWNTDIGNTIGDYQNAYVYYYNSRNWLQDGVFYKLNEITKQDKLLGNYNYYTNYQYDANGNIKKLLRSGFDENAILIDYVDWAQYPFPLIDNLTYNYQNGNQLDHVDDTVTGITNADDIKDQATGNYSYNEIGQLIDNVEEGVSYTYNASGLVTEVQKNNMPLVKFYYSDKGQRERKESFNTSGTLMSTTHYVRDAAGSVMSIYTNGIQQEVPVYGATRIGVYYKQADNTIYQLTDHLGNVRALISKDQDQNLVVHGNTDYYPFGMPMPNRNNQSAEGYRYSFQGQEKDPETGKEAFQLRLWDSRIGRWLTTDPAGQYSSPYLGMGNSPINGVDADGGWFWKSRAVKRAKLMGYSADAVSWRGSLKGGYGFNTFSGSEITNEGNIFNYSWISSDNQLSPFYNAKYPTGSITNWEQTTAQEWSESNNFFKYLAYDATNSFYTTGQMFLGRSVGDYSMRNLNGTATTTDQGLMSFVDVAGGAVLGKIAKGASTLDKIVSTRKLWNIYQKGTKGLYSTQIKSLRYHSLIKEMNSDIIIHNLGVQAKIHGNITVMGAGLFPTTVQFYKK